MAKKKEKTYKQQLHDKFVKLAAHYDLYSVFSEFCSMAAISISNSVSSKILFSKDEEKTIQTRERVYLDLINKYPPEFKEEFPKIFALLVLEMEEHFGKGYYKDCLGELFMSLRVYNKNQGQFFTPDSIGRLIGDTFDFGTDYFKSILEEKGYITMLEPACGGGALILGACESAVKAGLNLEDNVLVYATDLDSRCVAMTYIQLSLYGIPAIVQQKNALLDDVLDAPFYTPVFKFNVSRGRYLKEPWHC